MISRALSILLSILNTHIAEENENTHMALGTFIAGFKVFDDGREVMATLLKISLKTAQNCLKRLAARFVPCGFYKELVIIDKMYYI